jgi:hypothetical protein
MSEFESKSWWHYSTAKYITVKEKPLAFVHYTLQLGILLYIFVFTLWYRQGYQVTHPGIGAVVTKVKGAAYDSYSKTVFDIYDFGNSSLFLKISEVLF